MPVITSVAGATEVRLLFGVEIQRISRWQTTGKLPPPYIVLGMSPLWVIKDMLYLQEHGEFGSYTPAEQIAHHDTTAPEDMPLLGTHEAAAFFGVAKSQISRWRHKTRNPLPKPSIQIAAGPIWTARVLHAYRDKEHKLAA